MLTQSLNSKKNFNYLKKLQLLAGMTQKLINVLFRKANSHRSLNHNKLNIFFIVKKKKWQKNKKIKNDNKITLLDVFSKLIKNIKDW